MVSEAEPGGARGAAVVQRAGGLGIFYLLEVGLKGEGAEGVGLAIGDGEGDVGDERKTR